MNCKIRYAEKRDIPALIYIWNFLFHDPVGYIEYFYSENFDRVWIPVCTVDDKIVSIVHVMKASIVTGGDVLDARFLYCGGTLPEYREHGCFKKLMDEVIRYVDINGCALFVKPAAGLFDYYRSFGFEHDACFRVVTIEPGQAGSLSFRTLDPEEYNILRNAAFCDHPYVKWPDEHIRWSVAENDYCGGRTIAIEYNNKTHFLMGVPENGILKIIETDMSADELRVTSGALCKLFGTGSIKAFMPDYSCSEGEEIVSSFIRNAPLLNSYVNLILI